MSAGGDHAVDEQNDAGETPLHLFVDSQGRPHMRGLKLLLQAEADASIRDSRGRTALQRLDARTENQGAAKALAPLVEQMEKCFNNQCLLDGWYRLD